MQVTLDLLVACTYVLFPNSAEFGLKGLSPNHSQGKSPWRLGLTRYIHSFLSLGTKIYQISKERQIPTSQPSLETNNIFNLIKILLILYIINE